MPNINDELQSSDAAITNASAAAEQPLLGRARWIADAAWKPRDQSGLVRAAGAAVRAVSRDSTTADSSDAVDDGQLVGRAAWLQRAAWKPRGER